MTKVDQFESVFRSAAKEVFAWQSVEMTSVMIVTDADLPQAEALAERVRRFLAVLSADREPTWWVVAGSEFTTIRELLDLVNTERPDLICTYRHLHSPGWRWPYTLGDYLEVLTQESMRPVLVLPHPRLEEAFDHALQDTNVVMAITDHLTGDHRLVNYAARFTEPGGTLYLTHIEDGATFERYLDVISKIETIDTDDARARIRQQLLKEPTDFIKSCRDVLNQHGLSITVETEVAMGHRLSEYRRLIDAHHVDLLVFNTKDEDQFAMHGLAYPLAVELRQIPLLML